jgi:hypothetical protein
LDHAQTEQSIEQRLATARRDRGGGRQRLDAVSPHREMLEDAMSEARGEDRARPEPICMLQNQAKR